MAWYEPGRNSNHPGDPPPRWAPLSKAARLALAVTVIAGIVIALLIIASRSAAATDDTDAATIAPAAASPSVAGQRVEVPGAALAATFPADWVIEFVEEGSDRPMIVLAQPDRFGPEVGLQPLLVARAPNMDERSEATFCTLVRYAPIDITADAFLREVFGRSDSFVIESLREGPSRVLVNDWIDSRILTDIPEARYVDHYAVRGDDALAVLICSGVISHRPDWQSIAESIEFLPEEE